MLNKVLFSLSALLLLSSCSSENGGVKLDSLLDVANSSSGKNLTRIASSNDPKSAAKAPLEHKRDQWERDPMQLERDIKVTKRDFDNLMDARLHKINYTLDGV